MPAAPPGTAAGGLRTCPTGAGLVLAIPQSLSDPAEVCGGSLPLGRAGQRLLGLSSPDRSRRLLWNWWKSSGGSQRAVCGAGAECAQLSLHPACVGWLPQELRAPLCAGLAALQLPGLGLGVPGIHTGGNGALCSIAGLEVV